MEFKSAASFIHLLESDYKVLQVVRWRLVGKRLGSTILALKWVILFALWGA
jgi:hypothetical protein